MAADVHANAPFSAQEFGTHLAVQSQTLAKLMETNVQLGGATKRRARKLSWLQAGVHKARLRSARCSTWTLFCQTSQEGFYQRPQTDAYHEAHDS